MTSLGGPAVQVDYRLRSKPSFSQLLAITADALAMWPPDYVQAFLGPVRTWFPPYNPYSEFTLADPWQRRRLLRFLAAVTVPSFSRAAPPLVPPLIADLLFQPTEILQRPDNYNNFTSHPAEHWFFINGICTNSDLAQLNARCLTALFHRPITLIQNATDGALLDLDECSLGKEWFQNTESATAAFPAIYDALKDPAKKRVVVVCHSQGTIIMAVVLRGLKALDWHRRRRSAGQDAAEGGRQLQVDGAIYAGQVPTRTGATSDALTASSVVVAPTGRSLVPLGTEGGPADGGQMSYVLQAEVPLNPDDFEPLTDDEWDKLEIYCFANCANEMRYRRKPAAGKATPHIESFANEHDFVARLGMLAPDAAGKKIHIDGPFYVRPAARGHLLNADYLIPIAEHQQRGRKRGGSGLARPFALVNGDPYPDQQTPRLFSYINGGSPGD